MGVDARTGDGKSIAIMMRKLNVGPAKQNND
jgi:hypothetical protein